jgi:hypothetical protein
VERPDPVAPIDQVRDSLYWIHANESGKDDPAMGCAVERVTGGEHESVEAAIADDAPVSALDDLVLEDPVVEGRVRKAKRNAIADSQRVDMPKPGAERRPVGGDRHRPAHPWERRLRVMARALGEIAAPTRSLHENGFEADPRDLDAAERTTHF